MIWILIIFAFTVTFLAIRESIKREKSWSKASGAWALMIVSTLLFVFADSLARLWLFRGNYAVGTETLLRWTTNLRYFGGACFIMGIVERISIAIQTEKTEKLEIENLSDNGSPGELPSLLAWRSHHEPRVSCLGYCSSRSRPPYKPASVPANWSRFAAATHSLLNR